MRTFSSASSGIVELAAKADFRAGQTAKAGGGRRVQSLPWKGQGRQLANFQLSRNLSPGLNAFNRVKAVPQFDITLARNSGTGAKE